MLYRLSRVTVWLTDTRSTVKQAPLSAACRDHERRNSLLASRFCHMRIRIAWQATNQRPGGNPATDSRLNFVASVRD
jgi:hypothetical protein